MPLELPARFLRVATAGADGAASVGARAIYILPTARGLAFGLLLLVMLLGSINYANNLGFMLTFLLAGVGVVAMLHTWRNLLGVRLSPAGCDPVFAGQTALFRVRASTGSGAERPGLEVALPGDAGEREDLARESTALFGVSREAGRRGRLPLGRLRVSTLYPTGLFRAWSYLELDTACLVYPAPGPAGPRPSHPVYDRSETGDKGVGVDDFVGLRRYRQGDSPRQIDWKAAAREQGLLTKQFGGDRADRLWLDFDAYPGLDTESVLSRLCRGVLDAAAAGHQFGMRLPGRVIEPGAGQAHRDRCLEALALFGEAA